MFIKKLLPESKKNHSINCKDINNLNTTIDKNHKKTPSTLVQFVQHSRDQWRSSTSSAAAISGAPVRPPQPRQRRSSPSSPSSLFPQRLFDKFS